HRTLLMRLCLVTWPDKSLSRPILSSTNSTTALLMVRSAQGKTVANYFHNQTLLTWPARHACSEDKRYSCRNKLGSLDLAMRLTTVPQPQAPAIRSEER